MKNNNQLLSTLLSMMVFCAVVLLPVVPAAAAGEYRDDFEFYTVYNEADESTYAVVNSNNLAADGNWKATDFVENRWWKNSKVYVEQVPDGIPGAAEHGKALKLERAGDGSVTPAEWVAPHPDLQGGYKLSFDFHRDPLDRGTAACMHPFYFNVSEDGSSYYELNNFDTYGRPFSLYHVENGQKTAVINGNKDGWGWCEQTDKNTWIRVEIVYYNGALSYKIYDTMGAGKVFEQGRGIDPNPLTLSGDKIRVILGNGTPKPMYIDNFSISAFDPYVETGAEPDNVIYDDVAKTASFSGGVFTLAMSSRIRKITMETPAKVEASADGTNYETLTEAAGFSGTDWLNTQTGEPFQYIRIAGLADPEAVNIYGEVDLAREYTMVFQSQYQLSARIGGAADGVSWRSSNEQVAAVTDGLVNTQNKGTCVLMAEEDGKRLLMPIRVLGEMDLAEFNGTTEAYLAQKKGIVDAFNAAIGAGGEQAMVSWLTADDQTALAYLRDFDHSLIESLEAEQVAALARRLLTYPQAALSMESLRELLETVETEIYVGELVGLDSEELKAYLTENENAKRFNLALDDKYYLQYETEVLQSLSGSSFASLTDLQNCFTEACLMIPFRKIISSPSYGDLIQHFQAFIGYDAVKYGAIKNKQPLFDEMISQKNAFASPEQIRDFIDSYTPAPLPTPTHSSGGSSGGGGRKTGGSSGGQIILPPATPTPPPDEQKPYQKFPDVGPDHWAFDDVSALTALKIMDGYDDGSFRPEASITRAEFVKLLVEAFAFTAPEDAQGFSDVSESDWFYEAVLAAGANNILLGDGGKCNPNGVITREEMAALAFRAAEAKQLLLDAENVPVFSDQDSVSEWALVPVMRLCSSGVLSGMPDGTFLPGAEVTRAQAARAVNQLRGIPVKPQENAEK